VAIFYVLTLFVLSTHELAHAHATKHYGARVPSMGFLLIYLTPAFYTDTTEGYVLATKYERIVIVLAGVWSELMICAVATPIWWGTPPDTSVHEAAYFVMLMTGFVCVLINWNPLMKLDGYQILCEIIGVAELKEDSTAYVSAWVKRYLVHLPVEVPYVPKGRRLGFAVYALLSGAYSYTVLYVVARFAGNVVRNFSPEWGFIPEIAVALLIFRSRIRKLVEFMKFVYLDKKDHIRSWFTHRRSLMAGSIALILVLLPLWHESAWGRFVLEAGRRVVIRAVVPGTITEIYANEGLRVTPGVALVRLRNLPLQSRIDESRTAYEVAASNANTALLHHANLGLALRERDRSAEQNRNWQAQGSYLDVSSPLAGIVLTPHLRDRLGAFVTEGSELVEVGDLTEMRARVYVSEHDIYKVGVGALAKLVVEGIPTKVESHVISLAAVSSESDPGITERTRYSGLNPPRFYAAQLTIPNNRNVMKPGMVGTARIYGERRSIAGFAWEGIRQLLGRKVW
jgi:putative peptide zinc metalloprotease protein